MSDEIDKVYGDLMSKTNRYAVAVDLRNFSHGVVDTKNGHIWVKTGLDFHEADQAAYDLNKGVQP